MRDQRGVTVAELVIVLALLAISLGGAVRAVGDVLPSLRVHGAAATVYQALHLAKAGAAASTRTHGLVVDPGGRALRVVEDIGVSTQTVFGPVDLGPDVVASSNVTIRFSARGFAVPAGTITVRSGPVTRRVIVNFIGRVRIAPG
jgi:Tfp pilus assembly protein FimT